MTQRLKSIAFGFFGAAACVALFLGYQAYVQSQRDYQIVKAVTVDVVCGIPVLAQKYKDVVKCPEATTAQPGQGAPGAPPPAALPPVDAKK